MGKVVLKRQQHFYDIHLNPNNFNQYTAIALNFSDISMMCILMKTNKK